MTPRLSDVADMLCQGQYVSPGAHPKCALIAGLLEFLNLPNSFDVAA